MKNDKSIHGVQEWADHSVRHSRESSKNQSHTTGKDLNHSSSDSGQGESGEVLGSRPITTAVGGSEGAAVKESAMSWILRMADSGVLPSDLPQSVVDEVFWDLMVEMGETPECGIVHGAEVGSDDPKTKGVS